MCGRFREGVSVASVKHCALNLIPPLLEPQRYRRSNLKLNDETNKGILYASSASFQYKIGNPAGTLPGWWLEAGGPGFPALWLSPFWGFFEDRWLLPAGAAVAAGALFFFPGSYGSLCSLPASPASGICLSVALPLSLFNPFSLSRLLFQLYRE